MRVLHRVISSAFALLLISATALAQSPAAPVSVATAGVAEVLQLTGTITAHRVDQLSVATAGLVVLPS